MMLRYNNEPTICHIDESYHYGKDATDMILLFLLRYTQSLP